MEDYQNIAKYDIEEKLSGQNFLLNRIVSSALLIGPFIFFVIVIFLFQKNMNAAPEPGAENFIGTLIMVFLVLAVLIYSMAFMFPKIFLKKEKVIKLLSAPANKAQNPDDDPVVKLIVVDRTLMIIRLAMLEGVTLFGFVILMLSVMNFTINTNNNLWLLVIPWLVQLVFTVSNYFNKEKVVERIFSEILIVVKNEI